MFYDWTEQLNRPKSQAYFVKIIYILQFFSLQTLPFIYAKEVDGSKLLNMKNILPPQYDNLQPPKENGKPTVVRFHVWVLSIDSIDEGSMTYVADIFISQSWKDHRLKIPDELTNTSSNYRLLPLKWLDYMWRPDSFFKNAKQVKFQEMTIPNHYIWLYSDKRILYMVNYK